ncbi:hypothetical protein [Streptomyces rishiriensis]|uniref:Uncharacterized protein n=1 Tax=Streptomyces rishiriensis TaxID=68264 RepID=A0ABU0NRW7_STRRH|nr:hypothetical protein [Streptomyces rishiriensis]MDQ0581831.1 hypothetical protein [Streptomyces rishiriensis]
MGSLGRGPVATRLFGLFVVFDVFVVFFVFVVFGMKTPQATRM